MVDVAGVDQVDGGRVLRGRGDGSTSTAHAIAQKL